VVDLNVTTPASVHFFILFDSWGLTHGTRYHAQLPYTDHSIGVLSCEEMDVCNPPDLDMVAQAVPQWVGSCRQQLLHVGATVQNTYVQCFHTAPLGGESPPHPYLRAGLRIAHSLV
jgi:hypothetical protein